MTVRANRTAGSGGKRGGSGVSHRSLLFSIPLRFLLLTPSSTFGRSPVFLFAQHPKSRKPDKTRSTREKKKKPLSKLPGSISLASCWDCVARGCGKLDLGVSLSTSIHEIRHLTGLLLHCVALPAERLACVRLCVCVFVCSAGVTHFSSVSTRCLEAYKMMRLK